MIVKNAFKFALLALATATVTAAPEKRAPKPKAVASSSAAASSAASSTTAATAPATTTGAYPNNWNWQTQYPPLFDKNGAWLVPPTDSAQAKEWIASVNMSAIAKAPVIKWDKNGNPINPFGTANPYCDWTFDGVCTRPEDIVTCPQKGVWGLTFDDGPTQYSGTLYDTLAKNNVKATLFYVGLMVAQYPQYAQRACAEGHQLAIHTWSHHVLTSLTTEQVIVELKWTEAIIKEVCGVSPRYFRPPQGDYDDRIRNIASQLGFIPVLWDLDTNDWTNGTPGGVTAAQEDANFTMWEKQITTDTHGHICLQHELSQFAVDEAAINLPNLMKVYNVVPVTSCIGEAHPYKESTVFFPILDASGKLTWTNTTNTTAATTAGTASAGGTGSVSAAAAASGSASGSPVSTVSSATRASVAQILFAFVAVLAFAISF